MVPQDRRRIAAASDAGAGGAAGAGHPTGGGGCGHQWRCGARRQRLGDAAARGPARQLSLEVPLEQHRVAAAGGGAEPLRGAERSRRADEEGGEAEDRRDGRGLRPRDGDVDAQRAQVRRLPLRSEHQGVPGDLVRRHHVRDQRGVLHGTRLLEKIDRGARREDPELAHARAVLRDRAQVPPVRHLPRVHERSPLHRLPVPHVRLRPLPALPQEAERSVRKGLRRPGRPAGRRAADDVDLLQAHRDAHDGLLPDLDHGDRLPRRHSRDADLGAKHHRSHFRRHHHLLGPSREWPGQIRERHVALPRCQCAAGRVQRPEGVSAGSRASPACLLRAGQALRERGAHGHFLFRHDAHGPADFAADERREPDGAAVEHLVERSHR
mmetsp:Transcript_79452/g.199682  ORF Transcript_79452/g.199682 Transcript_79452/m.199682 type:complete len:381 (-) Transcript_79452:1585-2727(-)